MKPIVLKLKKKVLQPVAYRGESERGDGHGHPRQGGIQRVKLQKLKFCN